MRRAFLGELRFELLAEILGLRKFPLRLRDLDNERLAGAVQRTRKLLVVRTLGGELRGNVIPLASHGVAIGGKRLGLRVRRRLEFGKCGGHALKLGNRRLVLVRRAVDPVVEHRGLAPQPVNFMSELIGFRTLLRNPCERGLAFGLHACQRGFRVLQRDRRGLFRILRHRKLPAELIHFRLENRIGQQALRTLREARVLFLQRIARALGRGELPGEIVPGDDRRGVLGLDFCDGLLARCEVAREPRIRGLHLCAQPVALGDQRADLRLQRRALLAQLA